MNVEIVFDLFDPSFLRYFSVNLNAKLYFAIFKKSWILKNFLKWIQTQLIKVISQGPRHSSKGLFRLDSMPIYQIKMLCYNLNSDNLILLFFQNTISQQQPLIQTKKTKMLIMKVNFEQILNKQLPASYFEITRERSRRSDQNPSFRPSKQ